MLKTYNIIMNKMKIGIIGCGFVGSALKDWIEENNQDIELRISDPSKGYNDEVSDCDAYFIQIHIPTEEDGTQDLKPLEDIINELPKGKPIWIRTTILPGTSRRLSETTGRVVYHMPEFLTERTYKEDFKWQPMIFTGKPEHVEILKRIFVGKKHIEMTSVEAEMAKYAHNVFGALKVTYFNCIYSICQKMGIDYGAVLSGILNSTYINEMHTKVPGPDGKFGYGGKCFPKDVKAFERMFRYTQLGLLIGQLEKLNSEFRVSRKYPCKSVFYGN